MRCDAPQKAIYVFCSHSSKSFRMAIAVSARARNGNAIWFIAPNEILSKRTKQQRRIIASQVIHKFFCPKRSLLLLPSFASSRLRGVCCAHCTSNGNRIELSVSIHKTSRQRWMRIWLLWRCGVHENGKKKEKQLKTYSIVSPHRFIRVCTRRLLSLISLICCRPIEMTCRSERSFDWDWMVANENWAAHSWAQMNVNSFHFLPSQK